MEAVRAVGLCFMVFYLGVSVLAKDDNIEAMRVITRVMTLRETNATFAEEYDKVFISNTQPERAQKQFHCPVLAPSPTIPASVHSLRPGDIKVICAMGDSLTAGRGVEGGLIGLLIDYRGKSWSIGGDKTFSDMATLPNILKLYNSHLYGYSEGVGSNKARLNVAQTGAKAGELLDQAKDLVEKLKSDKNVNIAKDWKLITIFIGANDLCDWCEDQKKYSAENYKQHLQQTLDYLHAHVPRAFVNLVQVLNVEFVTELAENLICTLVHAAVCDCAANPRNAEDKAHLITLRKGYQKAANDLVTSGRYDTRDDFTVVLQPFYLNTSIPTTANGDPDLSYFASDCFHLSKKGQVAAAEALWNNMVEPVGAKRTSWTPQEAIECPTEQHPYLYTTKNSGKKTQQG